MDPDLSQTASIDSRNSAISITPIVKESWFEQLLEFVAGKFILLSPKSVIYTAALIENFFIFR